MHSFEDNDTKGRKMLKIPSFDGTDPRLRDWNLQTKNCRRLTRHTKSLYPELNLRMLRTSLIREVPEI